MLTKKIESFHSKTIRMPTFILEIVMSAWALSHASVVLPFLIAVKGIKIDEVNKIWESAYRKIYRLPKWVSRDWVIN